MIIQIRKVENGYVITQERDYAIISPQQPTFVAKRETDAHRIVGELLGVLSVDEAQGNGLETIDNPDFSVASARTFIDLSESDEARAGALFSAFYWSESPQGHDYWDSICSSLYQNEHHPNMAEACEIVARSIEKHERDNS